MLRIIYLQSSLSINGRSSLKGRILYDELREVAGETLLAHFIVPDADYIKISSDSRIKDDVLSYSMVNKFNPTFIYIEGGLFANDDGMWKIPKDFAEILCERGTVIVVADNDTDDLIKYKKHYEEAFLFFNSFVDYGDGLTPLYGCDFTSYWRSETTLLCKPSKMIFSQWLSSVYKGIESIMVDRPIKLISYSDILATGNQGTTGTLQDDRWKEQTDVCPFASVKRHGYGYLVFMTGWFSADVYSENCRDNPIWMKNVAQFLTSESQKEAARSKSHLKSQYCLFISHRSVNKDIVRKVVSRIKEKGIGVWFDEEELIPSNSLVAEISRGLESMTHFVLFWSCDCVNAPWVARELQSAIAKLIENRLPLIIVRLDDDPVPAILADIYRIEGSGKPEVHLGDAIVETVEALARRT